jgi:hypothetical protein
VEETRRAVPPHKKKAAAPIDFFCISLTFGKRVRLGIGPHGKINGVIDRACLQDGMELPR